MCVSKNFETKIKVFFCTYKKVIPLLNHGIVIRRSGPMETIVATSATEQ